jgi:hypothetical protein
MVRNSAMASQFSYLPVALGNMSKSYFSSKKSGAARICFIAVCTLVFAGCARHHSYIDPNGNVITVGHQPIWGPKQVQQESVIVSQIPTHVEGAKVVATAPAANANTVVGVVNPAIPEAVIVNAQPSKGAEPGLTVTGAGSATNSAAADAPPTQISGGIKPSAPKTD